MGGPNSVYDSDEEFPSKNFEIEAIKHFSVNNKPVLGFCLGSQLIAYAFEAKVYPNTVEGKKFKETGFYNIGLTKLGKDDLIFNGFLEDFDVFQWHGDVFDLPKDSELLAYGDIVRNQAFKIKNAKTYAMLFHLDFLPEMVKDLIRIDNQWLHFENKADEKEILRKAYKLESSIKENGRILFRNWMRL